MTIEEVKEKFEKKGFKRQSSCLGTDKLYFVKDNWQFKADIANNKLTVLTSTGMVEDTVDLKGFLDKK